MKNCRNCVFADWYRNKNGRRDFGGYAKCTYQVQVKLPASRGLVAALLAKEIVVREYRNVPVDCEVWERAS